MITSKELELFEEKMKGEEFCRKQGSKILSGVAQRIKERKTKMITSKELELFEKKMRDKEYCVEQGSKILTEMVHRIKDSTNFAENDLLNWSDYGAWDNWDRTG